MDSMCTRNWCERPVIGVSSTRHRRNVRDAPEGQGACRIMVDHVARLGRWVVAQRQVDAAAVQFRLTPAQRGVGLFGFAVVKLARQFAVAVGVTGQQDDAGGFPVQAVDDQRFRVAVFLQAGDQAVLVVVGTAGTDSSRVGLLTTRTAAS
jgi:hypothetical protein